MKIVICAGTYDNTLCGWEWELTPSNEEQRQLTPIFAVRAHIGCIKALSAKGKILATGGDDEVINVFDVVDRTEVGKIMKLTGSVTCIEMFGHSHLLAGSSSGVLSIHRMSDWEPLWNVKAHNGGVRFVSVHPTGRLALTVGDDQKLKMWNLIRGRIAYSTKLKADCELVRWSPSGSKFAFTGLRSIQVHDSKTGEAKHALEHTKKVLMFAFLNDTLLVSGGEDRFVYLWNTETGECLHKIEQHKTRVRGVAGVQVDVDSYAVATVDTNGEICVWRITANGNSADLKLEHSTNTGARFTCVEIINYGMSQYLRNKKKAANKKTGIAAGKTTTV